jgi:hypothetical protein
VCKLGRRYLKTIDLCEKQAAPCLPVERIVIATIDDEAQERGYAA